MGHTMEEIRKMSLTDFGDIIGYMSEKQRGEAKVEEQRRNKKSARSRG